MFSRIVSSFSSALDLNIATLSGCIDIIVVPQEDGSLRSTPFHVRFGKTKLLRSREKTVTITVNGKETNLKMKLGAAGEAFFEEDDEELMTPDSINNCRKSSTCEDEIEKHTILDSQNHKTLNHDVSSIIDPLVPINNVTLLYDHVPSEIMNERDTTINESNILLERTEVYGTSPPDVLNYRDSETSCLEFSMSGHLLSGGHSDVNNDNDCFNANIVTWDTMNKNPHLWYHPSLVCRFDLQPPFYPGKVALPLVASWVAFNRPLTLNAVKVLLQTKIKVDPIHEKGFIDWMFGPPSSSLTTKSNDLLKENKNSSFLTSNTSHQDQHIQDHSHNVLEASSNLQTSDSLTNQTTRTVQSHLCGTYLPIQTKRSLRPSINQLEELSLNPGANTITFTVTSSFQGTKTVSGSIYLWPINSKIIVSDVDGTITRSDVLGQLMPIVGRDWSHAGVADLFSKCRDNNYKILYLTARAIGQADATRDYLFGLRQGSAASLPDGPLIMSPDRLFPSFKREVIDRKPYVFKIAALRDIRQLFPQNYNPFYAGFGNRDTDHWAYVHIGIPESRVFIIDPKGTLHHINSTYAKTYESMGAISEHMFPSVPNDDTPCNQAQEDQFNDFQYWKLGFEFLSEDEHDKTLFIQPDESFNRSIYHSGYFLFEDEGFPLIDDSLEDPHLEMDDVTTDLSNLCNPEDLIPHEDNESV